MRLLAKGFAAIGYVAIASSHMCHCANHAEHISTEMCLALTGYAALAIVAVGGFLWTSASTLSTEQPHE